MNRVDLPGETWLPVPGWEGIYEVSDMGRVWSVKRFGVSKSGRILKMQPKGSGHLGVSLRRDCVRKQPEVHRLVLLAFVGPRPAGMETRHLDGDPTNNRLTNLRYGTRSENTLDRAMHRAPAGVAVPHCRRGHPYTTANTASVSTRPNARFCRTCRNDARQRAREAA